MWTGKKLENSADTERLHLLASARLIPPVPLSRQPDTRTTVLQDQNFITRIGSQSSCQQAGAWGRVFNPVDSSCLAQRWFLRRTATQAAKFRPHLGTCLILGRTTHSWSCAQARSALLSALFRDWALALSLHSPGWTRREPVNSRNGLRSNHYGQLRAENPRPISVFAASVLPLVSFFLGIWIGDLLWAPLTHCRVNRMRKSSRRLLTWSVHNAGGECRNSSAKEDAAETGWRNGNGQIRRREAIGASPLAVLVGQYAEIGHFAACIHAMRIDWSATCFRSHRRADIACNI